MGQISLLGSFDCEQEVVHFSINDSQDDHSALVEACCKKMSIQDMDTMTLELDNQTFLFLIRTDNNIRFIEGKKSDALILIKKVKLGLEGQMIPTPVTNSKPEDKKVNSHAMDDTVLQNSMLQSTSYFEKSFSKAELFFKPLEETGGDFYWSKDYQYKNLVILGDCTGHGTLGAMIAMSVLTLLKHFFRLPPTSVKKSLLEFHKQMKELMEEEVIAVFDVEIAILLFDKRTNQLNYAGSGINLVIKSGSQITQFKSRKSQISLGTVTEATTELKKGDQLFISSDGILDQFDTENHKKLGSNNFVKMIENTDPENSLATFTEQLEAFRGSTTQLDDQSLLILTI